MILSQPSSNGARVVIEKKQNLSPRLSEAIIKKAHDSKKINNKRFGSLQLDNLDFNNQKAQKSRRNSHQLISPENQKEVSQNRQKTSRLGQIRSLQQIDLSPQQKNKVIFYQQFKPQMIEKINDDQTKTIVVHFQNQINQCAIHQQQNENQKQMNQKCNLIEVLQEKMLIKRSSNLPMQSKIMSKFTSQDERENPLILNILKKFNKKIEKAQRINLILIYLSYTQQPEESGRGKKS